MNNLIYVPKQQFESVLESSCSLEVKTEIFSNLCRINCLYMIQKAGSGHIGTSFSSIDLFSWIMLNEINLKTLKSKHIGRDIFFSSKGHDAPAYYSVLIGLGLLEFDNIHKLRRIDGLPGHPDVNTPHIETNTGSLGMGISKAKGFVFKNRVLGISPKIFVMTGDGELQEGQIWESLQSASTDKMGEITVIIDHNKIQSDTWVSKTSDLGDIKAKFESFGWSTWQCNGNSISEISQEFQKMDTVTDKPKVLIADTIKGAGVSFMDYSSYPTTTYNFHSGAIANKEYNLAFNEIKSHLNKLLETVNLPDLHTILVPSTEKKVVTETENLISAYSTSLLSQIKDNSEIVVLDADLVKDTGTIEFKKINPGMFIECGIAEQDMVSQAGAIALTGSLPIVHSFACFLSTRPNEQIYNNATEKTKIIYVGSLAGILPAGPGHSHQSVRDISTLSSIPDLLMIQPSTEHEVKLALDYCITTNKGSSYIRLVSIPTPVPFSLTNVGKLEKGKGNTIVDGKDCLVFSYGPTMLTEAYKAAKSLEDVGVGVKLINLPWLNNVDLNWLKSQIDGFNKIITIDDHYIIGGQGDMILSAISSLNNNHPVHCLKIGVESVPECGTNDEVLAAHGLDSNSLHKRIESFINSK